MKRAIFCGLLACIASLESPAAAQEPCVGDLNADRIVNGVDLGLLLADWGPCISGPPSCRGDLDGNGFVDGDDLGTFLAAWGSCRPLPNWATLIELNPDPGVVTDPVLREAIIETGWAWRVRDTATQIEMLLVPPGSFEMGCSPSDQYACLTNEDPTHAVLLTRAFYLGRYELTQAQWMDRMGSNPSVFAGQPDSMARPVENMTWYMVLGFLAASSSRLPTEAEWEFACRAGTTTAFSNGTNDDDAVGDIAWFGGSLDWGNSGGQSRPVGTKVANPFGFHDMHGNVWEFVDDASLSYTAGLQVDPRFHDPYYFYRTIRGGSWLGFPGQLRSSRRDVMYADQFYPTVGLRIARDP